MAANRRGDATESFGSVQFARRGPPAARPFTRVGGTEVVTTETRSLLAAI